MSGTAPHATHVPALVRAFDLSEGDVLEIGTGYFSTTLLHWLAAFRGRKIVSYETDLKWFERAKRNQCEYHDVFYVSSWDEMPLDHKHWGVAFVDHAPAERRIVEIERLKNLADYIVIHDSEPINDKDFHYSKIFPLFKYRYDDRKSPVWTSVLSNFNSLEKFET